MTADREEFLSDLAHAAKSPVHNALGFAELLRMGRYGAVSSEQEEVLARIEELTEVASEQLEVLFDFLELVLGAPGEKEERVDLRSCLRAAAAEARVGAGRNHTRLELRVASDCGAVTGQPSTLRNLFSLLICRAESVCAPDAAVTVRAGDGSADAPPREESGPPAVRVVVAAARGADVGDGPSGDGAPPGSDEGGEDAFGIIARHLVRLHGGEIELVNRADGFRATCRLPAHRAS